MSILTSETSLEVPACFQCDALSVKFATCPDQRCPQFGPAHKVFFCKDCLRAAACKVCGTALRSNEADLLPSVIYSTSVATTSGFLDDVGCGWDVEEHTNSRHVQLRGLAGSVGALVVKYCLQCGAEDLQGRQDEVGRVYCAYCWECWEGRVVDDAISIASQFSSPQITRYDDLKTLYEPRGSDRECTICVDVVPEDCLVVAERLKRQCPASEPLVSLAFALDIVDE